MEETKKELGEKFETVDEMADVFAEAAVNLMEEMDAEADDLIELCEDDDDDSEDSDGLSTGTKVALGIGGIAAAALATGGVLGLRKLKNRKKAPKESTSEEEIGPTPIPDSKPTAKAIRGRKITLRERLTGHIYLDPNEVAMMQQLAQETQTEEEEEES